MTSCCGVKNLLTSQEEVVYWAEGVPQDEGSTEVVALVTSAGTSLRYR